MKKFYDYFDNEDVNEKYKLILADGADTEEEPWLLELNISDIWNKYNGKTINEQQFLESYKNYLVQNKPTIVEKIGNDGWGDLVKILGKFNTESDISSKLDEVYDWGDKYGVKINA